MPRNVYIAIMKAARSGVGLRLTAAECHELSCDDAIETHAGNCLDASELVEGFDWAKCDPSKPRTAANQCIGDGANHPVPSSPLSRPHLARGE
jgi:hypothetical protein